MNREPNGRSVEELKERVADALALARELGASQAEAAASFDSPAGAWSPIRSSFGWHLVRVEPRGSAEIDRDRATRDLIVARRSENRARLIADLRKKWGDG